jgi:hypothetical protein
VAIRTEEEYHRLLAAALMEKPENGIPEEDGRLLELLSILIDPHCHWVTKTVTTARAHKLH